MTRAVIEGLRERLSRLNSVRKRETTAEELLAIGRRCAATLKHNPPDHAALLYDERGLPRWLPVLPRGPFAARESTVGPREFPTADRARGLLVAIGCPHLCRGRRSVYRCQRRRCLSWMASRSTNFAPPRDSPADMSARARLLAVSYSCSLATSCRNSPANNALMLQPRFAATPRALFNRSRSMATVILCFLVAAMVQARSFRVTSARTSTRRRSCSSDRP
jgi:hypothetical protein